MPKALIYTAGMLSKGNSEVAKYISDKGKTDIFNLKDLMRLNLDAYDTVIFGTGNNGGNPDRLVMEFMHNNMDALINKKKYLYVVVSKDDEKTGEQVQKIGKDLGVPDVVSFNKRSEDMNNFGMPSSVDDFISGLE
ncbi:MAG: hypothetical protein E7Z64_05685 [Thermoplasmata archaeon]|jgi:menaquinone-dependent protoporphyrinogen IX oxidase|nr:hypothetical protein [Thermoplasmata archaeon]